jgi:hypothetical protein
LHRPWYAREVDATFLRAFEAVKGELDSARICNPGVLVPAGSRGH